ncbi:hypothetical protein [Sedimentibacter sp.]|uniref:hypothetical protein n=1 Tax=Sedimentibacter sp. TaxID=1960295 RepID=UPI0028A87515|nr:hypothetical protein [Sedimentibacter sp.]
MKELTISIKPPDKILKGAGIPNTSFIPSYIYKLNIELINNSNQSKLCSFSSTLGNGIRYLKNMEHTGPDNIVGKIKIVEPCEDVYNNNVIVFANNISLSPNSTNIITLDIGLCDKYTIDCIENTGDKISHKEKIHYYGHLICESYVDSCSAVSLACDYEFIVKCDADKLQKGESTKYYIHCRTGQYDMARSVYVRCVLDNGLEFIGDSSNLQPEKVYSFNGKTIIKWNVGSLQPSEIKRIGYMVKVKEDTEQGSILKSKLNSNCVNNSTYTQCPSSCEHLLTVE